MVKREDSKKNSGNMI